MHSGYKTLNYEPGDSKKTKKSLIRLRNKLVLRGRIPKKKFPTRTVKRYNNKTILRIHELAIATCLQKQNVKNSNPNSKHFHFQTNLEIRSDVLFIKN